MAVSCMRNASGHNYRNNSFIVDVAMGHIPRSTERISRYVCDFMLVNNTNLRAISRCFSVIAQPAFVKKI